MVTRFKMAIHKYSIFGRPIRGMRSLWEIPHKKYGVFTEWTLFMKRRNFIHKKTFERKSLEKHL